MADQTYADNHDRDKLSRWHTGLASLGDSQAPAEGFPALAVFLVGPEDVLAHNVFRRFRSEFETSGAGFDNLVIFGQHGHSTGLRSLMSELGLERQPLPLLALLSSHSASAIYTLLLTPGMDAQEDKSKAGWEAVLSQIVAAVGTGTPSLDLSGTEGVATVTLADGPLIALVSRVLQRIS